MKFKKKKFQQIKILKKVKNIAKNANKLAIIFRNVQISNN